MAGYSLQRFVNQAHGATVIEVGKPEIRIACIEDRAVCSICKEPIRDQRRWPVVTALSVTDDLIANAAAGRNTQPLASRAVHWAEVHLVSYSRLPSLTGPAVVTSRYETFRKFFAIYWKKWQILTNSLPDYFSKITRKKLRKYLHIWKFFINFVA